MSAAEPIAAAPAMSESQKGLLFCLLAHLVWGGMAAYFGLLRHVSPAEIAIHRGLWALPVAGLIVLALGQWPEMRRALASPRTLLTLAFTSFLIVFNWGFYVWSIGQGRTLESSLGYFVNPLMNVAAGYLFLGERFSRAQFAAIGIAAAAVAVQTIAAGVFPWLGLMLGATFCLYGFIRKTIDVGPTQGFFIETAIVAPPALALAVWFGTTGQGHFGLAVRDTGLLIGCGILTAAALLLFASAIKRIRYSTAGLMQYISPSLVFLTAVFVFGETLDVWRLLAFVLLWIALAIYSVAALHEDRVQRRIAAAAESTA